MYYRDLNGMSKAGMRHGRVVGCDFVTTWSREIDGDHFLEVEAGTNGYQEEEEENGCGVYLSVRDLDGKGIHVLTGREDCKRVDTDELLFLLRGNRQLNSVKEALRWMLSILEVQSEGVE